jgi:hypothetical protein
MRPLDTHCSVEFPDAEVVSVSDNPGFWQTLQQSTLRFPQLRDCQPHGAACSNTICASPPMKASILFSCFANENR